MRRHLRAIRVLLNALLLLALLYTVTLCKALLIPLVLAAFIGLALNPIVASTARHGVPRWLGASVLMLALIGGIGTGIGLLTPPALDWIHEAPSTIRRFVPKLEHITQPLEAANRATQTLVNGHPVRVRPQPADVAVSAWDVVAAAPKVLAAVLTVVLLVFFFLVYGDLLLRRLVEIGPDFRYKRQAVSVVRGIQHEVSRYILTTLLINFMLGALTAGILWQLRMPDPLLWGAVAMFANFIPYVGAIFTTSVLLLVGLAHFDDIGHALLPALCFAGLTVFEGNLVTPLILGRRMRLSPIAILVWLLVWGWLWGIPGALLAVPMLTSVKLITEHVRGWAWFGHMVQR
ncbi:AI-2E family transporter [Rhodanobacter sp. Si-c]|uniref:AI-2E family transporter n=1 Tax=Rhodanobacter lycopersici TaxID=3162487 RepID=A0ABV3QE83_9GAMM